jgi:hypothetical protein|tara:strand:- start:600 stop:1067 length:468 start_codon:yes stop_codon:yes gene_type:complete
MFDKHKHNIILFEIILGYIVYFFLITQSSFSLAVIWMMFVVYAWLLSSLYLKEYTFNSFLYIISISGVILSISFFFIKGIEELPFPEGALMFHSEEIAKALFIFFICTIPIVLSKNNKPKAVINHDRIINKINIKKEKWEEATEDDIRSGNYEPL